jgi:streptogramin lyase
MKRHRRRRVCTEQRGHRIGRRTPGGVITEFPIQIGESQPTDIAAGADGNLWFTEFRANVDELVTMVTIALGDASVSTCPAGDADGNSVIEINEIIAAVSNALGTCV